MKPGFDSRTTRTENGTIEHISSLQPPKPCAVFLWTMLAANARSGTAEHYKGSRFRKLLPHLLNEDQILAVSDALEKLAVRDKQKAHLVKLRYFVGMTTEEAAEVLGISVPTADRHWAYSRAWLAREIKAGD
jgi:RNA polymerase sigma factor (sigma-70 family)